MPSNAVGCAGPLVSLAWERWDQTRRPVAPRRSALAARVTAASTHLFAGHPARCIPVSSFEVDAHREALTSHVLEPAREETDQVDLGRGCGRGDRTHVIEPREDGDAESSRAQGQRSSTRQTPKPGRSCGDGGLTTWDRAVTEGVGLDDGHKRHPGLAVARPAHCAGRREGRHLPRRAGCAPWACRGSGTVLAAGRSHDRGRLTAAYIEHHAKRRWPRRSRDGFALIPRDEAACGPSYPGRWPRTVVGEHDRATRSTHTGLGQDVADVRRRRWPRTRIQARRRSPRS